MIDFVSTHADAHPQTIACARLLAAVIAQAIEDASKTQKTREDRIDAEAATEWLFNPSTTLTKYAYLIGANAQAMREAMLEPHKQFSIEPTHNKFDEGKRRRLRQNHVAWVRRKEMEKKILEQNA